MSPASRGLRGAKLYCVVGSRKWTILVVGGVAVLLSCGGPPTAPSPAATIEIRSSGLVPAEVRIESWRQVMFTNTDTRPHSILSDPIDSHTECPPVNQVGLLNPGESRTTGTLNLSRVCRFHDHLNQSDETLKGRIIVQ